MKTIYLPIKRIFFIGLLSAYTLIYISCSKKIQLENSDVVPAARGDVVVKKDKNNNYNIKLEIYI